MLYIIYIYIITRGIHRLALKQPRCVYADHQAYAWPVLQSGKDLVGSGLRTETKRLAPRQITHFLLWVIRKIGILLIIDIIHYFDYC